jgi:hypothetical protein
MVSKNDDSIMSKVVTDKYRDASAAIFETKVCKRCGKVNPAEIHTCAPKDA